MSEFRRRLLMQSKSELPSGYIRCEYLESFFDSNGVNGQYINTGRIALDTDVIKITIAFGDDNKNSKTAFGWRYAGGTSDKKHCYIVLTQPILYIGYGNVANRISQQYSINEIFILEFNPNKNEVLLNNKNIGYGIVDSKLAYNNGNSVYPPLLFTTNNMGTPFSGSNSRIYDYEVKDKDGNVVQHLIPALDVNGKPCMFDLISKSTFYNQRTNRVEDFRYKIL